MRDAPVAITSRHNPRVKRWRAWMEKGDVRRNADWALLEGPHLIEAALAAKWRIREVWYDETGATRHAILLDRLRAQHVALVRVTAAVLTAVSDTATPQGLIAEVVKPQGNALRWGKGDLVIIDGVQEPGNVGALLRVAAAAGCAAAWLAPGSVHAWSPKVLRAAMGAHMVLPIFEGEVPDAVWQPYARERRLFATVLSPESRSLDTLDLSAPAAWVFGNEGAGVRPIWQARGALPVILPLAPGIESLNVATAAAVFLFEARRQRTARRDPVDRSAPFS
ncbi:TrmH family RNA methyltransferase [Hydrogenophilus thiooxidans]|uniref:TrmH family RNA methyltransferase n=1 Tax=Hydrogenophilus thiooxidans TaxID=2820326 RepID=UPI001C23ED6A|nr:RNA methyltransferase [Hydrogenophilus thiooxidans]